ncbi:hypothetical protein BD311DRAFT_765242 [Dichomitus squalens]|uniref:Uncharacterized protein n=1 Tax=Dichomitus squalens TaxID=114155 RepID=A0A4Q9MGT1_9APHY|nr:hypothetical protein BD311DRAFT_765242 [Dichomitus squalens]
MSRAPHTWLGVSVAYHAFPFSDFVSMAVTRFHAGHRLSRFVYQPLDKQFDHEESHRLFSQSISSLSTFVDSVEHLHSDEERLCPLQMRECWNIPEAEQYWSMPKNVDRKPKYGFR